jgi:hypothetical protein
MVPHLFSPISALSAKIKHDITFQCVRNAPNKSIEFPDFKSYFFRFYSKTHVLVILYKAMRQAR